MHDTCASLLFSRNTTLAAMQVLFVCSANKDRSRTAEVFLSERYKGHTIYSAGTNQKLCMQEGTEFITKDYVEDADIILVMEQKHLQFIKENLGQQYTNKVKVLGIEDIYKFGDATLQQILIDKSKPYIGDPD